MLMTLLALVLVLAIVLWATQRLLTAFSVGDPLATVVYVLVMLVLLSLVVSTLGIRIPGVTG